MHKLMMTSNAYRMSSQGRREGLRLDPANSLFWRFNMRRLTAEEVRDSILAVSGRLNLKMGGPSVYPPIPREVLAGQSMPGTGWEPSPPDEAAPAQRLRPRQALAAWCRSCRTIDQADTDSSCPGALHHHRADAGARDAQRRLQQRAGQLFAERFIHEVPQTLEAQVYGPCV